MLWCIAIIKRHVVGLT